MPDATAVAFPDAGFDTADLTTFCRLDELGLVVTGQRLEPKRARLACRVVEHADSGERWCRRCGCEGVARDTVTRRLAHEPFGWRPTTLVVTIRRYSCTGCTHVWRQDTSRDGAVITEAEGRAIAKERYQIEPRRRDNVRHQRMRERRKQAAGQESQESHSAPTSQPANNKPTSRQVA